MVRWDAGLQWHLDVIDVPTVHADDFAFVRDEHLRSPNGTEEDAYVHRLIATATLLAQRGTQRAVVPQTLELVMDAFPASGIELPCPPLRSVTSITYLDPDGVTQTLGGSPLPFNVVAPVGPHALRAIVFPFYGETWPDVRRQPGAVRVRYEAGYDIGDLPEDIRHGMLLVIGELYKQRSESVHAFAQNPALIRARDLWQAYRIY